MKLKRLYVCYLLCPEAGKENKIDNLGENRGERNPMDPVDLFWLV